MAYRTLQIYGTSSNDEAAALISVDDQIVHAGPLPKKNFFKRNALLFEFVTDVTLHGKVSVKIQMIYGSMILTHVRAVYPAVFNGSPGFVSFLQPMEQPLYPHVLPLEINHVLEYNHYMFNGPEEWIVDQDVGTRYLVIDNVFDWQKAKLIKPNWKYQPNSMDVCLLRTTDNLK